MQNLLSRCLRAIFDRAADAIMLARLWLADLICGPYPETEADRLRAARLRRLMKEGRALGLLDDGEDEVTLAWHEAHRQFRRR
jgi:hypothetical protein